MSTLTQFLPQGDSFLGEYLPFNTVYSGPMVTLNTREFLRTGTTVSYASKYAPLMTVSKAYGMKGGTAIGSAWQRTTTTTAPAIVKAGSNYHVVYVGTNFSNTGNAPIRYGSSFAGSATDTTPPNADNNAAIIRDAISFNGRSIITGLPGDFGNNDLNIIWSSSSTTYTSRGFNNIGGQGPGRLLAASPSLCVAYATALNGNGSVRTSTNGDTWTNQTANIGSLARVVWSPAASAFIGIRSDGTIWTTTDGYTFTQRTAPDGMPTSITQEGAAAYLATSTGSATYMAVGGSKILKITGLTNYTILDYSALPGLSNITFTLAYDGTRLIRVAKSSLAQVAYSTDEGVTWTSDFNISQVVSGTNFRTVNTMIFIDSSLYVFVSGSYPFFVDYTGNIGSASPSLVGVPDVVTWASGSGLSSYIRIA